MFDSIVGQDEAVTQLTQALTRPVNSYVFYGARGTFVEEAARIFAARLIDESGESDHRISQGLFADVIEFEPMGTTYRVKEDVRESMLAESRKSAIEGAKKVLIIHDAHLLRNDSANTLLKSLEEPSENMHWILIAPSPDLLLQTIQSRCYEIQFARLTPEHIEEVLVGEGIDPAKAKTVSVHSAGRLDRARKLANDYAALRSTASDIVRNKDKTAAYVARSAKLVTETFDEIASDVIAKNKTILDTTKKQMKDSGYSDKIAQSIVTSTKNRLEATEKRLRSDLLQEFLDALQSSMTQDMGTTSEPSAVVHASQTIDEYRKRLVFNPSELLFLESLLASISLREFQVNS